MSLPVLTAVTGEPYEAELVSGLERTGGVTVVRRCVDLPELLAAAAAGTARAVLLGAALRRLDRDALVRIAAAGLAVVGLVSEGDEDAERRLRQLGVAHVLPATAGPDAIAAAVAAAVAGSSARLAPALDPALDPTLEADLGHAPGLLPPPVPRPRLDALAYADTRDALPRLPDEQEAEVLLAAGTGRLVAVWGPTGAPGRTTVAVNLAAEASGFGLRTLLADADPYGGCVAQVLGLLDESPGLAAAARLAGNGDLDLPALARVAPVTAGGLRVLTGITRADRWPELRPASLEVVWDLTRSLADLTVVDVGFCLEQDEELSFDSAAPRRNGATLATVEMADVVVAVCAADPVGVQRFVRGVAELREVVPGAELVVVLNRVRRGPVGSDPERQLSEALERYAGLTPAAVLPHDPGATDLALLHGRTLAEVAPQSPLRPPLQRLAAQVGHVRARPRRRRRLPFLTPRAHR